MQQHPYMNHGEVFVRHSDGHGGLGFVLLVVFTIVLAALIGYVVARLAFGHRTAPVAASVTRPLGDDPLALVRLRYARGEIDRETFLQTSADLGGEPPPAPA